MAFLTPVVLIVFKRADCTERVIDALREIRPQKLWIVADGARQDRQEELEQVSAVRRLLDERIDWTCDLRRVYSEMNIGCAHRVVSGLNTVFSEEEEAIILEDDCVPHETFFSFCCDLLE